jgi:hypothetical protein
MGLQDFSWLSAFVSYLGFRASNFSPWAESLIELKSMAPTPPFIKSLRDSISQRAAAEIR